MNQRMLILRAAEEIDELLQQKLKAKGQNLRARLGYARRKLPSKIRRQAELVASASERLHKGNQPGLADPAKVLAAHKTVVAHLDGINLADLKQQRAAARRKWVADYVINFAIFLGLLITAYFMFGPE